MTDADFRDFDHEEFEEFLRGRTDDELEGYDSQEDYGSPSPPPLSKAPTRYFLATYPSDDMEVLLAAGLGHRGISMRYPGQSPPRPPECLFDQPKCTDKVIELAMGDHTYCNCVKCTAILEETASPEEREYWFETRSNWIAKARQERAVYISRLAAEVELNARRSTMVVSLTLGLSDDEMQDWEENGHWEEKALESVLKDNSG